VRIQEYLIATIQNIEVLLRYGEGPKKSLSLKVNQVKGVVIQPISAMMKDLMNKGTNEIMSLDFARVGFAEI
jgi:hypothetical protein